MNRHDGTTRRRFLESSAAFGSTAGALVLAGCLGDGNDDTDDEPDGLELDGVVLHSTFPLEFSDSETGELVAEAHYHEGNDDDHWHMMPLSVPHGETRTLVVDLYDATDERLSIEEETPFELAMRPTNDTPSDLLDVDVAGELLDLFGMKEGEGDFLVDLRRRDDGETVWTSPELQVVVE